MDNDLKKKLDELVKNSNYLLATPETLEQMINKGLPVKSHQITYSEYIDKLFEEKKRFAQSIISQLPLLKTEIANATASALYNELRECFILGIPGAGITLAIILLEYSCRHRLFKEKLKTNKNTSWSKLEKLLLGQTINKLKEYLIISEEEHLKLEDFNKSIRNNYLHYNIRKLVKDAVLKELPSIKIDTGEVNIEKNVDIKDKPYLWFSAKRALDNKNIIPITKFCIDWTNKFLSE